MAATQPTTDDLLVSNQQWWSQPLFLCASLVVISFLPVAIFHDNSYVGNADIHAILEMCGSLIGLIAGFAIISRFYALGNRLYLFIGLAFIVNASEDFVHGLLAFEVTHNIVGLAETGADLWRFIPGTYVTGRLLLGIILILAPFLDSRMGDSSNPKKETIVVSLITLATTVALTAFAFTIPLPDFIYPDQVISRPVDFFSAIVIGCAFIVHYRVYRRKPDYMHIWVLMAISIDFSGQLAMSLSSQLYDAHFDVAHIYKLAGYTMPLLGFCIYHIRIVKDIEATKNELIQLTMKLENARQEAESLARKAEQASLAKSFFLARMSHEFRTPMNAILGFTKRLLKKTEKDINPRHLDALWSINWNGQHLLELIDSVLDLSKIEAGKMTYYKSRFDLKLVCREVAKSLEPLASRKGLKLVIEDVGPPQLFIEADLTKIRQVMTNLISNAIKYTNKGSVSVRLDIDSINPCCASIKVTDTGIGIKPADQSLLFQPFQQLDSTIGRKVRGTGLGLVVSSEFISGHNGTITVESIVDEGSTFTVTIPLDQEKYTLKKSPLEAE